MATKGARRHVVVMGVSGCGKSVVGAAVASWLERPFAEGDEFHPPENIAKMESGTPLNDEDRWPWLRSLADWIAERDAAGEQGVVTCSALKRSYRDVLRKGAPGVVFVHLHGDFDLIAQRQGARQDHFMPSSLLQSQFDTLEPLADDEEGVVIDVAGTPEEIAEEAMAYVQGKVY